MGFYRALQAVAGLDSTFNRCRGVAGVCWLAGLMRASLGCIELLALIGFMHIYIYIYTYMYGLMGLRVRATCTFRVGFQGVGFRGFGVSGL